MKSKRPPTGREVIRTLIRYAARPDVQKAVKVAGPPLLAALLKPKPPTPPASAPIEHPEQIITLALSIKLTPTRITQLRATRLKFQMGGIFRKLTADELALVELLDQVLRKADEQMPGVLHLPSLPSLH